jgi:hypothetical protein
MQVPIERILLKIREVRASVDANAENLADAVEKMLQQCASGEFLQAITMTVRTALNAFFGSYSGSKAIRQNYLVAVGPLGGIYRIDYFMYSYRYVLHRLCLLEEKPDSNRAGLYRLRPTGGVAYSDAAENWA